MFVKGGRRFVRPSYSASSGSSSASSGVLPEHRGRRERTSQRECRPSRRPVDLFRRGVVLVAWHRTSLRAGSTPKRLTRSLESEERTGIRFLRAPEDTARDHPGRRIDPRGALVAPIFWLMTRGRWMERRQPSQPTRPESGPVQRFIHDSGHCVRHVAIDNDTNDRERLPRLSD